MVYEPREDSYLLAQAVKQYASGSVIDVGTGSGIQASTAAKQPNVQRVVATDIDEQAVKQARSSGVDAHQADLFFEEASYDTIVCNAPYLPDEPLAADPALDGGPKGYEWTIRFLSEAKKRLNSHGRILLLISTLTNQHVIEEHLLQEAMSWQLINQEKHFFEELLVYNITHALPEHPRATYIAKGKRSRVYKVGCEAIKLTTPRRVAQEAKMLQKANELGLGPTYKEHSKNYVRMSYVQGMRLEDFATQANKNQFQEVLEKLQAQATTLDEAGINKQEMTNPYKHVLVTSEHEVIQIDWERARATTRPQNHAQLQEYIKKLNKKYPELFI